MKRNVKRQVVHIDFRVRKAEKHVRKDAQIACLIRGDDGGGNMC